MDLEPRATSDSTAESRTDPEPLVVSDSTAEREDSVSVILTSSSLRPAVQGQQIPPISRYSGTNVGDEDVTIEDWLAI